ncbi:Succinate-semialdehyde dehydrogenase [NADP(+)] 1 [Rubripirellula tenax]|uniref:Succinate-semialdehyde dehydrogenase [NADP(+)] 1 n=1 Tax=Rubripirellula tenax TaxID=2528015 RepID=A0A5C6EJN6_9BACT|nr:NAD-dependent succinate-semialdehyde dehydrogenase [Rubripirellula tenax]TWU48764.1 Succinate-semialdehyde dehydrogenase [NADP(+)] 1 [Rubripirellula tenax]
MKFVSINPANNETIEAFETQSKVETLELVKLADQAYRSWRTTTFDQRKEVVIAFASLLRQRVDDLAQIITREMGKRISESRREVEFCAQIAEFYANGAESFLANQQLETADADVFIRFEPIGVLLGVMPWNYPFYQVTRFAAPNIMAGNAVMVKHAENVPRCAQVIADLFDECRLPSGVYTNLFIPTSFVEAIVSDIRVQGVSLTGSERAGAAVASLAGKNLKRSVLELGGNDPFIVLEDADMDATVEFAVKGRMANTGQSCVAAKRFIVVKSVADEFLAKFKQAMSVLKIGDPMDDDTTVAPLSTEQAAVALSEQVQASVDAGATVLLGGDRPARPGAYFNPTILTDVTPGMPTYDQELFGPVATVYVVDDEEAAIQLANDSSYGLGGSIYTRDIDRGQRIAERIESGMIFINQPTTSQADLPFGGVKNSGYGRELSHLGILEFVNKKLVHLGSKGS